MQVADPYRWLEDPDSEETQKYVDAVNQVTQPYLENCDQWQKINKKLTKLWNYPKYTVPDRHGDYYFSYQNTGLQNQKYVGCKYLLNRYHYFFSSLLLISVLFKQKSVQSEPIEFLDPNKLSADGTIALQGKSFSEDGSLLAYGLSESGSDWIKIKFRDVQTGEDFPDVLSKVKFSSMSWTHDNKGLFYCVSHFSHSASCSN